MISPPTHSNCIDYSNHSKFLETMHLNAIQINCFILPLPLCWKSFHEDIKMTLFAKMKFYLVLIYLTFLHLQGFLWSFILHLECSHPNQLTYKVKMVSPIFTAKKLFNKLKLILPHWIIVQYKSLVNSIYRSLTQLSSEYFVCSKNIKLYYN